MALHIEGCMLFFRVFWPICDIQSALVRWDSFSALYGVSLLRRKYTTFSLLSGVELFQVPNFC